MVALADDAGDLCNYRAVRAELVVDGA